MVALLAEGVDRNLAAVAQRLNQAVSPSSRRAWIEMTQFFLYLVVDVVALLAEGVDRNLVMVNEARNTVRRPPRGGRG